VSDQGKTYAAFVESELENERERRTAFDGRGQTLVGVCGSLVTLMTGLITIATAAGGELDLSSVGKTLLFGALATLALAAACGIAAGWNYLYDAPTATTLERMLTSHWTDDEIDARNHVAAAQVWTLDALRRGNNRKARWIGMGQIALLAALAELAVTVALMMSSL
jgi:hypothetical protein